MTACMTLTKELQNMIDIVKMNANIMRLGNEYAEELWFMTYPDGADESDQRIMASDPEMMQWLREDYAFIMSKYGRN